MDSRENVMKWVSKSMDSVLLLFIFCILLLLPIGLKKVGVFLSFNKSIINGDSFPSLDFDAFSQQSSFGWK